VTIFNLTDKITEWFRGLLIEGITRNFTDMFDRLNVKVNELATQVGATPQSWNSSIFTMVRTLSETVVIPVAGMILTFVLCYELIHMVIERNNMSDFSLQEIYKWIIKACVAVYILTHTFDIVMAVFDLAQHVVNSSAGVISGSLDVNMALTDLAAQLDAMDVGGLVGLYIESAMLKLAIEAMSICIFIIIFGRMIEIYLTESVAPIPFSTLINREWGHIGNSYIKSLFALAFQGFLIMLCVAIYAALLGAIPASTDIQSSVWYCAGLTILLCFTLFRSASVSKALFSAH
jgi:hypothetical protein